MIYKLPSNLKEAEKNLYDSLFNYISTNSERSFLSINLRFEGLKLNPIVFRLSNRLKEDNFDNYLLWADAGGAALAKRDKPDLSEKILTFKEYLNSSKSIDSLLLICSPQPYDIEMFETVCSYSNSTIVMINGKLEDPIVGIGSVGREIRKRFTYKWESIYYIQPLSRGALLKMYPEDWQLYSLNDDGYSFSKSFSNRPDDETILLNI